MKNLHLRILVLFLIALGGSLTYYKVSRLGLPLFPTEQTEVWTIETRLEFRAGGGPVKAQFFTPNYLPGYTVIDEDFVSSKYGLTMEDAGVNRIAQWAVRRARGNQVLYYRIQLAPDAGSVEPQPDSSKPKFPAVPDYGEPMGSAAMALLDEVRSKSADVSSFTRELLVRLNASAPDENVKLLRKKADTPEAWAERIISILAGARIPARIVHVLYLEDGMRHGGLRPWLEVHDGEKWIPFNPQTADRGFSKDMVPWYQGDAPLLQLEGAKSPKVEFSVSRHPQDLVLVASQRAREMASHLMEYSLFSLPVQTQNVYRILLLIPLGAFLMVVLRNIVGVKTFGTFMPILIALAFRETELLWGVVLFSLIVALGLMLRFYLEYLKLLLVPRLAAVLIIVVLLMTVVTLLSHKLGLERGLSVALFPMVILAMTIERMSLVWEEHGPAEALQQGLGSLLVAALGYLVMTNELLGHLIFVFPELLLIVLGLTLLLGRYTGYRLSELWRFRALIRSGSVE